MRLGEQTRPLNSCSTQESRPYTYLAQTAYQRRHTHPGGSRAGELNLSSTKIKRVGPVPYPGSTVELVLKMRVRVSWT